MTFKFVFENIQSGPSCGLVWPIKKQLFFLEGRVGGKHPIWAAYHPFPESKHLKDTENRYYVLSPEVRQKA